MMSKIEYWYVKARNIETGEEIQRIAATRDGISGPSGAELEMSAFLVRSGRANPDLSHWEIVEVHPLDGGRPKEPLWRRAPVDQSK